MDVHNKTKSARSARSPKISKTECKHAENRSLNLAKRLVYKDQTACFHFFQLLFM